jgi:hypothetical protein
MSFTGKSLWVRATIFGVIAGSAIALLVPSFQVIRHEHQVKTVLLEIQRALQEWHVAEEVYPRETPMNGGELISLLMESGHLEKAPSNPWTGRPYEFGTENLETDRIRYSTDELAETYSLRALERTGDDVFLELDSTEHQSLE